VCIVDIPRVTIAAKLNDLFCEQRVWYLLLAKPPSLSLPTAR
jgi:hypothetical protein